MTDCGLLLFTRFPAPGHTKTRLIPALGAAGAANLQRQMTESLIDRLGGVLAVLSLQVYFTGGTLGQMQDWLGHERSLLPQGEGDLGERLRRAFQQGFASGLQHVVVVGSDCPLLGVPQVMAAFAKLRTHDVVIGPATDGGYYLMGLSSLRAPLFEQIPWGSDRVFEMTRAIALQHNLSVALLETLSDIDRPEDLAQL